MKVFIRYLLLLSLISFVAASLNVNGQFSVSFAACSDGGSCEWSSPFHADLDEYPEKRSFILPRMQSHDSATQHLRVKIEQVFGGASHLDCIFVESDSENAILPVWSSLNEHDSKKLLSGCNNDIVPSVGEAFVVEFATLDPSVSHTLSLVGRIEADRLDDVPFVFPTENLGVGNTVTLSESFYKYVLGSGARISQENGYFRSVYFPVGSGHPQGTTYFWIDNDDQYIYVDMDLTADNTEDGDEDYGKVLIKTRDSGEVREFKISELNQDKWGTVEFTYTPRVSWEHKVYHFKIPFRSIGFSVDDSNSKKEIDIAFAAYGTVSPAQCTPACDSNSSCIYLNPSHICANETVACIVGYAGYAKSLTGSSGYIYNLDIDEASMRLAQCEWMIEPTDGLVGQQVNFTYTSFNPTESNCYTLPSIYYMNFYDGNSTTDTLLKTINYVSGGENSSFVAAIPAGKKMKVIYRDADAHCPPIQVNYELIVDTTIVVTDQVTSNVLVSGVSNWDLGAYERPLVVDRVFAVKNEGTTMLILSNMEISAGDTDKFFIQEQFGSSSVLPNETTLFTVRFDAGSGADGDFGATVRFSTNDVENDPFTFELSLQVTPPEAVVREVEEAKIVESGSTIDLGGFSAPFSFNTSFEVSNEGSFNLNVSNLYIGSSVGGDVFEIVTDFQTTSISPGGSPATFTVSLKSNKELGDVNGTVSFDTNVWNPNQFKVFLTSKISSADTVRVLSWSSLICIVFALL